MQIGSQVCTNKWEQISTTSLSNKVLFRIDILWDGRRGTGDSNQLVKGRRVSIVFCTSLRLSDCVLSNLQSSSQYSYNF